jgi:hypothetical protein
MLEKFLPSLAPLTPQSGRTGRHMEISDSNLYFFYNSSISTLKYYDFNTKITEDRKKCAPRAGSPIKYGEQLIFFLIFCLLFYQEKSKKQVQRSF